MSQDIHSDKILVLDFGSQYTQLIARRIREAGVYCEIHRFDISNTKLKEFKPKGIILSGGPESVHLKNTPKARDLVFALGVPVLGVCYGMQSMAVQLGGIVKSEAHSEYGYAQARAHGHSALLLDIQDSVGNNGQAYLDVWMSHGDRVETLPTGFKVIASTANTPIAAIADEQRNFYGIQFHPEVTHTKQGMAIISRFVHKICACESFWTPNNIISDALLHIRAQVGTDKVLLGLSGGVDSSVLATLLHQAIGDNLECVFVDNGLLRLNEGNSVMEVFAQNMGIKVVKVEAEQRFINALKEVTDPEQKRKIIGHNFIEVFEAEAKRHKNVKWLAQGTIYPDVIESGGKSGTAKVIKSHHNVGGLPDKMNLKLLEPLKELFKDEVRKVGIALGLIPSMVYRHPFPGPGLGVRILGAVTKEYADLLRLADDIFISELMAHDLYSKVSQAFAVFLPVKSVGVTGDNRNYNFVICLRAVETIDFMTAKWADLPYDFLSLVSNRIINEIPGISRVVYDISGKPPATIEWE